MKKAASFVALLLFVHTLTACHPKGSVAQTNLYEPYIIAEVNVVLADDLNPHMRDQIELLDTDEYGRKLYRLKGLSVTIGPAIEMYIVSQMKDNGYVYYYPDKCYLIREEKLEEFSEVQVEKLKDQNDWGKPLSGEMMHRILIGTTPETVHYEQEKFANCVREALGLNLKYSVREQPMEKYSNTEQLFAVSVFLKDSDTQKILEDKLYLVFWSSSSQGRILAYREISIHAGNQEEIAAFRESLQ